LAKLLCSYSFHNFITTTILPFLFKQPFVQTLNLDGNIEPYFAPIGGPDLPLEIGNLVWCDSIPNAIQNACERKVSGMLVQLYDANGLLVGQDTTVNGAYYFNENNVDITGITVDGGGSSSPNTAWSGLNYTTKYYIVFANGQYDTGTGEFMVGSDNYVGITTADVNGNGDDNIDSDVNATLTTAIGSMPADLPNMCISTDAVGCGNHRYDLGIVCEKVCPLQNCLLVTVVKN